MATTFRAVLLAALLTGLSAVVVEVGVHESLMRRDAQENRVDPVVPPVASASTPVANASTPIVPPVVTAPVALTESTAYMLAVNASKPVAFWHLDDLLGTKAEADKWSPACGPDFLEEHGQLSGDPCTVSGNMPSIVQEHLNQPGLVPTNTKDGAIKFDGTATQEIIIPDSDFINTRETGYENRTIELWFKAEDPGTIERTIYEEGNEGHSGLNMYVHKNSTGHPKLFMYAWDRGNQEIDFGDSLVNPDPIKCDIEIGKDYYAALVFSTADNLVAGYVKHPGQTAVQVCGEMKGLPNGAKLRHHGHATANAVIGGVQDTTRASGGDIQGLVTGVMQGDTHNFVGIIDEVAIYNRALPQHELQLHVDAAVR